ncbi:MAG: conjugal transfer protein TraL [Oscillospiraceae bacterium]|nr:conjugal transfer protein TraL [Oscillospiraceae bacterium]
MKLKWEAGLYPGYIALPCAAGGLLFLGAAALRILGLAQGTAGARVTVLLLTLTLAALALVLLSGINWGRRQLVLLLPIGLAFFLRALCLDHSTLDYQDFLAQWAAFFRENGGFAAIKFPVGNYNAPYLYFMAAISYLPVPDLYLIKLFSILFDVLLAWGGQRLAAVLAGRESSACRYTPVLLLLLPTVVLNGSYWGQCDALYGALVVHALACVLGKQPRASVVLLAVAFSFKLQTIFIIPLWCALWFSGRVKFAHLWLFPLTYVGTILPALLLGKPLSDTLGIYLGQMEVNNELTFNAPSLYQFRPYGAQIDESLAARIGICAAFVLVLVLLAFLFVRRTRLSNETLLAAAVVLTIGVPFLLPYMHDRYFFLADVLTLIWACTAWRRFPQAVLIQFASLSAYATYLRLQFTCPIRLGPYTFPMGLEALAVLLALGLSIAALLALPSPAGGGTQKRIGPKSLFNILKNASWREIF